MELYFANIKDKKVKIIKFSLPNSISEQINDIFGICGDNKCSFLFDLFIEFDMQYHGKALSYLFNDAKLSEKIINNKKIYKIKKIKGKLDKNQILFLCAVLNKLSLKSYMCALVTILTDDFKMKYSDIDTYIKLSKFNMVIH